jgi:hypothetical protein
MSQTIEDDFERLVLVDAHAHLDELNDLSVSLREAKATGVRGIIASSSPRSHQTGTD